MKHLMRCSQNENVIGARLLQQAAAVSVGGEERPGQVGAEYIARVRVERDGHGGAA